MRGWTGIVLAGVVAALAGVIWLATVLVGQSRARMLDELLSEERLRLDDAARSIDADLNDVLEDLHFAVGWLGQAPPAEVQPQLHALLAIGHPYHAVVTVDRAGQTTLSLIDETRARNYLPALARAATAALARQPGVAAVAPVAGPDAGWLRAFTVPFAGGALALLVDVEPFFAPLPREAGVRVLLLDGGSRPLPVSDPALRGALADPQPPFDALVGAMRRGERVTFRWSQKEASAVVPHLGETVASVLPLQLHGVPAWSVAVLRPIDVLRAHERSLVARIALTAAAIMSCLLGLGGYLVVARRRGALLQERLRSAQALAHLHEKTEKIVDNIPAAVLVLGGGGVVTGANRAFRARAGGDVVGAPWSEAFPGASAAARERLARLIDEARTSGRVASLPGATLALFGAEGRFTVRAVPLEERVAEAQMLLVIEDLSELRALEDQLLRAEKLATVGVLAAGIAHEIGTPLGIVRGRAEYVRGKLGVEHAQAPGLGVILEQIDLISRTIRQLLDFSRARPPAARAVRLGQVARAVADLLRFEAERRKVAVAVEVPESLPPLDADADQLQQVLVNLVINALDASRPGGHVTIAAAPAGRDRVRVEVRDDGAGIAPEHRNQIFDPFFTTKKRGQGTGLGLTLCAQIVRDHGGHIEVGSEPGRGTVVTLDWPQAAPGAAAESRDA